MAANLSRGEVEIASVDGKQTWVLKFSTNALCIMEREAGKGVAAIFASLQQSPSISDARVVIWAGLQAHHKGTSLEKAGEIIDQCGGVAKIMLGVFEGLNATFAESNDEGPQTEAGSGTSS